MKKSILFFTVFLIANATFAKSSQNVVTSEIESIQFDKNSSLHDSSLDQGLLAINKGQKKIGLKLELTQYCPTHVQCITGSVPVSFKKSFSIIKVKKDSCGVLTITGIKKMKDLVEKIIVKDLSKMECEVYFDYETLVKYEQIKIVNKSKKKFSKSSAIFKGSFLR